MIGHGICHFVPWCTTSFVQNYSFQLQPLPNVLKRVPFLYQWVVTRFFQRPPYPPHLWLDPRPHHPLRLQPLQPFSIQVPHRHHPSHRLPFWPCLHSSLRSVSCCFVNFFFHVMIAPFLFNLYRLLHPITVEEKAFFPRIVNWSDDGGSIVFSDRLAFCQIQDYLNALNVRKRGRRKKTSLSIQEQHEKMVSTPPTQPISTFTFKSLSESELTTFYTRFMKECKQYQFTVFFITSTAHSSASTTSSTSSSNTDSSPSIADWISNLPNTKAMTLHEKSKDTIGIMDKNTIFIRGLFLFISFFYHFVLNILS